VAHLWAGVSCARVEATREIAVSTRGTSVAAQPRVEPTTCLGHGMAPLVGSFPLRAVDDVASAMVELQRERGVDIFVFRDLFVRGHRQNAERFAALADALDRRGIGSFATAVEARPTDADPEVFGLLRRRLRCIRAYIEIETDEGAGRSTPRRWARPSQNRAAIEVMHAFDLFTWWSVPALDPDTMLARLAAMATRFDVEVARHFHSDVYDPAWLVEAKELGGLLGLDSVSGLQLGKLAAAVEVDRRATNRVVRRRARTLGRAVERAVGRRQPLRGVDDRVSMTLERARMEPQVP